MSLHNLPLSNIKVLELEGLAPTVFTGMMLADYGADVIMINKPEEGGLSFQNYKNFMNRGKRSIILNLKQALHREILKTLVSGCDVLIDPYRPGVLEKMGLGPEDCFKINKRIIICRVTGYGQTGPLALKAGHDINYLSYSGALGTFGKSNQVPGFPNNILADFIGGGAMAVFGILAAIYERNRTGKGQVVDNSMTESTLYVASNILNLKRNGIWNYKRGENLYDSGAPFYNIYQCKDDKYLTVAATERLCFVKMIQHMQLDPQKERFCIDNQFVHSSWNEIFNIMSQQIRTKTSEEWLKIFEILNIGVSVVVDLENLTQNTYHMQRKNVSSENNSSSDVVKEFQYQVNPAPKLSNHPNICEKNRYIPKIGENTFEVLSEFQVDKESIQEVMKGISRETNAKL